MSRWPQMGPAACLALAGLIGACLGSCTEGGGRFPEDEQEGRRLAGVVRNVGDALLEYVRRPDADLDSFDWRSALRGVGLAEAVEDIDREKIAVSFQYAHAREGECFRVTGRRLALLAMVSGVCLHVVHLPAANLPRGMVLKEDGWGDDRGLELLRVLYGRNLTDRRRPAKGVGVPLDVQSKGEALGALLSAVEEGSGLTFSYEDYLAPSVDDVSETDLYNNSVSVQLKGVDVPSALDSLSARTHQFIWSADGRLVNVISTECLAVRDYPLNEVLERAVFRGTPYALMRRLGNVLRSVEPVTLLSLGRSEEALLTEVRVQLRKVTVREFLNVVCLSAGLRWATVYTPAKRRVLLYFHGPLDVDVQAGGEAAAARSAEDSAPNGKGGEVLEITRTDPPRFSDWPRDRRVRSFRGGTSQATPRKEPEQGPVAARQDRAPEAGADGRSSAGTVGLVAVALVATLGLLVWAVARRIQHSRATRLRCERDSTGEV